jgi:hypothetical protein
MGFVSYSVVESWGVAVDKADSVVAIGRFQAELSLADVVFSNADSLDMCLAKLGI